MLSRALVLVSTLIRSFVTVDQDSLRPDMIAPLSLLQRSLFTILWERPEIISSHSPHRMLLRVGNKNNFSTSS